MKIVVVVVLILIAMSPAMLENMGFEVTFIDVGQGDSIFIRTPSGQTVIIDGGGTPRYYVGDFDPGVDVVVPYLHARGIRHIDAVIVSHFDDDHARGLLSILDNVKVGRLVYGLPSDSKVYGELMKVARDHNIDTLRVGRGDEIHLEGATFKVLGPDRLSLGKTENDNSVVLKLTYQGMSFLFTGDLEAAGEKELIDSGEDLGSTVLKLGHHGSITSTSEEFLTYVKPSFAVISAGVNNSFGHPAPDILQRLYKKGIPVLRTDLHGGITFKIRGKDVKIYTSILEEH